MGLTSKAGSSSSGDQKLFEKWIDNPKELILSLNHDLTASCTMMNLLTRTQVRLILTSLLYTSYHLTHELFHLFDQKIKKTPDSVNLFAEALTIFYKKSNVTIDENEFKSILSVTGVTLTKTIENLIDQQQWTLLSECLLRLKRTTDWKNVKKTIVTKLTHIVAPREKLPDIERCLRVLLEAIHYTDNQSKHYKSVINYFENNKIQYCKIVPNEHVTYSTFYNHYTRNQQSHVSGAHKESDAIVGYFKENYATSPDKCLSMAFQTAERISAAVIFINANTDRKKIITTDAPLDGSNVSPIRTFFDKLFSDVFYYDRTTAFSWLDKLDLSDEIKKDPKAIIDRINQIIQWEYFDAVAYLLEPLSSELASKVISEIDGASWAIINEFDESSKKLINKIKSVVLSLTSEQLHAFSLPSHTCILSTFHENSRTSLALELYEKHHEFYDNHDGYRDIIIQLSDYAAQILEKDITEDFEKTINLAFLAEHQQKINSFIQDPKSFINLLNTHFILAYRYFEAMTPDQSKRLLTNAIATQSELIETLIQLYADGAYKEHGDKYKMVWKNQITRHEILRINEGRIGKQHKAEITRLNCIRTFNISLFFDKFKQDILIHEHSNQKAYNGVFDQILTEHITRNYISTMLDNFLNKMEKNHIKWPLPSYKIPPLIFELLQDGKTNTLITLFKASRSNFALDAMMAFFSHDIHPDVFDVFKKWLIKNSDRVLDCINATSVTQNELFIFLSSTDSERLNTFAIDLIKMDNKLLKPFIQWLNANPDMAFLIEHMNKDFVDLLSSGNYEIYGAALVNRYKETVEKAHPDFAKKMSEKIKNQPYLAISTLTAIAPSISDPIASDLTTNQNIVPTALIPSAPYADPPPFIPLERSFDPDTRTSQQLTQIQLTLETMVNAMRLPATGSSSSHHEQELIAENQRLLAIIQNLCKVVVNKSEEVATLQTKINEMEAKNKTSVDITLRFNKQTEKMTAVSVKQHHHDNTL